MANLSDINLLINNTNAVLYTEAQDAISHSAITSESGEVLMSFGPNDNKFAEGRFKSEVITRKPFLRNVGSYKKFALAFRKGTSDYNVYNQLPVDIAVNKYIFNLTRTLGKVLPYQGISTNCCNMALLSLWLNGIINIGIHPYILYASALAYTNGFRPDLFSYHLIQK
ncbi:MULTISPECIES: hypothetical protein [unclassified Butyricimonas]|uniref:hypothetical protein n=1 Tax=unclassified Butyricimonas TaxID=2637652 RepID=UPI001145B629|nr:MULTISPECIES: hypothetical protein [unclassified Butyricimonas]